MVTGDVQIWGRIGMVDTLALVLDRVRKYLAPAAAPATATALRRCAKAMDTYSFAKSQELFERATR